MTDDPTYPGAPEALIEHWEKRRAPMRPVDGEGLAPLGTDLAGLRDRRLPPAPPPLPDHSSRYAAKEHELRCDLGDETELVLLHRLNEDPGGLFRRIGAMRAKKRARIAARKAG